MRSSPPSTIPVATVSDLNQIIAPDQTGVHADLESVACEQLKLVGSPGQELVVAGVVDGKARVGGIGNAPQLVNIAKGDDTAAAERDDVVAARVSHGGGRRRCRRNKIVAEQDRLAALADRLDRE